MERGVKLVSTRAEASVTRAAKVEGAEIFHRAGFDRMLPDYISISWNYALGDSAWRLTWMNISGPRIKKDGNPGERRESVLFGDESDIDEAPEWARKFMTESAPELPPYK